MGGDTYIDGERQPEAVSAGDGLSWDVDLTPGAVIASAPVNVGAYPLQQPIHLRFRALLTGSTGIIYAAQTGPTWETGAKQVRFSAVGALELQGFGGPTLTFGSGYRDGVSRLFDVHFHTDSYAWVLVDGRPLGRQFAAFTAPDNSGGLWIYGASTGDTATFSEWKLKEIS